MVSLVAMLLLMGRHIYHAYNGGLWGILLATGLAFATMHSILRQHRWYSLLFAAGDVAYSLSYFGLLAPLVRVEQADQYLLSFATAAVIAFYSHEYAHAKRRRAEQPMQAELPSIKPAALPAAATVVAEAAAAQPAFEQVAAMQEQSHHCQHCEWSGKSSKALIAHRRWCKGAKPILHIAAD